MKKLVIASHNEGKVKEFHELLAPLGIEVVSAGKLSVTEPEETGTTFAANAELKAVNCLKESGLPSLSDDSGLGVEALNGAPGIYSARWAGPNKDFTLAFERIKSELGTKPKDAYFICDLCLALPGGEIRHFEGRIDGKLTFPPKGAYGFGYDPIFIPNGYDITFGEFDPAKKNKISHRALAFSQFLEYIKRCP
jgi:XTP/dITP diphosphohydrolase